jgi:hypothetical protein
VRKKSDKADEAKAMKEQLALFTAANAFRKAVKEREEEVTSIVKKIEEEASLRMF